MKDEIKERIEMIKRGEVPEGYKKTRVGVIPEDWEQYKMGKIVALSSSRHCPKTNDIRYKCIELEHIEQETGQINGWSISNHQKSTKTYFVAGDILYGKLRPYLRKYYLAEFNGVCSTEIWVMKSKANFSLNKFLFYLIQTERFNNIANISTGTRMPRADWKYMKNIRFAIPSLPEQQKIAQILSTWDKTIELKEKLIEEKKEQKKGLMQKLLTGEVRLAGFDGEWEEVRLGEVVRNSKGKVVEYHKNGKHPVIGIEYFRTGIFENFSNDNAVMATEKDVLILWDGANAGKSFTSVRGIVGSTFVKLECKDVSNVFLQKYLELDEKFIMGVREGSGIPHVPRDFLSFYKLIIPPYQEQQAIAQVLSTAAKEIELLREKLKQLKLQKKGLMQLLLTGIVRVKS